MQAECCSDHLHCCYEGTECDLVHAKCVNKTVSLPWMRRLPAKQALPLIPQVVCQVDAVLLSSFVILLFTVSSELVRLLGCLSTFGRESMEPNVLAAIGCFLNLILYT